MYDYRQKSGQGCLSVCLAYLCQLQPDANYERYMMAEGHMKHRDSFVLGMIEAFLSLYSEKGFSFEVCIGNRSYAAFLSRRNSHKSVSIVHKDTTSFLRSDSNSRVIVCLDSYTLGSYIHSPHYVIVLARCPKTFKIFDPWTGKVSHMSHKKIVQAITSLERHLRYSQVAIRSIDNSVFS